MVEMVEKYIYLYSYNQISTSFVHVDDVLR